MRRQSQKTRHQSELANHLTELETGLLKDAELMREWKTGREHDMGEHDHRLDSKTETRHNRKVNQEIIYQSIVFRLSKALWQGQQAKQGIPDVFSPSHTLQWPEHQQRYSRHPGSIRTKYPNQEQQLHSVGVWAPHPISKASAVMLYRKLIFNHFCLWPYDHHQYYKVTGDGWDTDGLVDQKLHLSAQLSVHHNSPIQC